MEKIALLNNATGRQPPVGMPLADALSVWNAWPVDIPPTGSTGDAALDQRLADAFRALGALPTAERRFTWIERQVFSANDFVPAGAPAEPYRETLMRWWLDLFDSQ